MGEKQRTLKKLQYHARLRGMILLFGGIFLLGVFLGTRVYGFCSNEELSFLKELLKISQDSTFADLFRRLVFCEGLLIFLLFFSGFSALGQLVVGFLLLFRGLGLGISGVVLAQQGKGSFQDYILFLLPQTLLFLLLQIVASRETAAFSMNFLRHLLGVSTAHGWTVTPQVYIIRYVLLLLLCIVTAFISTYLALFLGRLQ